MVNATNEEFDTAIAFREMAIESLERDPKNDWTPETQAKHIKMMKEEIQYFRSMMSEK